MTHYKGRGNHSVNTLEAIIEEMVEERIGFRALIQNLEDGEKILIKERQALEQKVKELVIIFDGETAKLKMDIGQQLAQMRDQNEVLRRTIKHILADRDRKS